MNNSTLLKLLVGLAEVQHNKEVDNDLEKQLYEMIYSNDLEEDEFVPSWLFDIFNAVLHQQSIEKTYFEFDKSKYGDVINFLAELEDVIDIEYDDYGEGMTFKFSKINMYVFINREGRNFYTIKKVK